MAKTYADTVAGRLNISDNRTLNALEARIRHEVSLRQAPPNADKHLQTARVGRSIRSSGPNWGDAVAQEVLGCILDWPELLDDAEVGDALLWLPPTWCIDLSAGASHFLGQKADTVEEFLAKIPVSIHAFAASQLAAPRHNRLEDARTVLLKNVSKLRRLEQHRRRPEDLEAMQRAAASGDFEAELALLQMHANLARERHGVGER